ncbi:hypothetical protein [Pseudoleptotrichia goodfellowii]|uniref:Uncharacterized protein n=1 Tax=Pseudoleptotrichia goodfellowii F0264 TaxID=596323 RepID=D0GMB9_9FUSO|nr:hypothetical protein [Pseudoleptotrichia goodfellowii]EEY34765.1 hypothetical protein HMPREF0554_1333 [Pseudoleptotrichia goodfellowii F0264]
MKTDKIIEKCKSALKKTSRDNKNDNMTESNLEVIDFDCLKDKYLGKIQFKGVGIRSNDALFTRKKKYIFIEFKNGEIKNIKEYELHKKIYDSLLIFCDIFGKTLRETREEMDYILVANFSNEKKSDEVLLEKFLKSAKIEERLRVGLRNFKGYCFKNVHTYSKEEFEEKFVKIYENV